MTEQAQREAMARMPIVLDDSDATRAVIRAVVAFLREHLLGTA
jgi:hypothetical protein